MAVGPGGAQALAAWVQDVIAATKEWLKKNKGPNAQLEGLWTYQQHNVVNKELLDSLLNSSERDARIAAQTVKQFWSSRL